MNLFFYFSIMNVEQNNILISFTELNPKLAKTGKEGFNLKDRKDIYIYNRIWEDVTDKLNCAGEPKKSTLEWKEVVYL